MLLFPHRSSNLDAIGPFRGIDEIPIVRVDKVLTKYAFNPEGRIHSYYLS